MGVVVVAGVVVDRLKVIAKAVQSWKEIHRQQQREIAVVHDGVDVGVVVVGGNAAGERAMSLVGFAEGVVVSSADHMQHLDRSTFFCLASKTDFFI